ncbi:endonuclease/exonuclease/phosphatase family protein [Adhaeribacter soli]|nr:endonuclease/exonuclease/phosphatase family protein [Adhaeribacter soli]
MKITLEVIGSLMILLSLLPLIKTHYWWIRVLDFPRMQIAFIAAVVLGLYLYFVPINHQAEILFAILLAVALVNQLVHVYRYTWLSPVQALRSKLKSSPNSFSFMISNVRMSNRRYDRFLKIVAENAPDLLLINEPDQAWAEAISSLDAVYKYAIKKPLENTYGMMLYSKFRITEYEIRYLIEPEIPSFYCVLELPTGRKFDLFTVHPQPPSFDKNTDKREAELLIVAKMAKETPYASIVAGDLNDVAWSYTTGLFRRISGLLDPRIGRGFYNTYNAFIPFFRYSLDHIFYDPAFRLLRLKRLPFFGSDHFPMLVRLNYEPLEADEHEVPFAGEDEKLEAEEMIELGTEGKAPEEVAQVVKKKRL